MTSFSPRKSGFFQRKGRKRVKEGLEVTFMKEWVKPLYIGLTAVLKYLGPFRLKNRAGNAVAALSRAYKNNICNSYKDSI